MSRIVAGVVLGLSAACVDPEGPVRGWVVLAVGVAALIVWDLKEGK